MDHYKDFTDFKSAWASFQDTQTRPWTPLQRRYVFSVFSAGWTAALYAVGKGINNEDPAVIEHLLDEVPTITWKAHNYEPGDSSKNPGNTDQDPQG